MWHSQFEQIDQGAQLPMIHSVQGGKGNMLSSFASCVLCSYPSGAANKSCIFTFVTELLLFLRSQKSSVFKNDMRVY